MDYLSVIKEPISSEFDEFSDYFKKSLNSSNSLLNSVIEHIMQRNGKMMRPMLFLLIAKLLGETNESSYHAAISLELLHNASLVHDDVVDESDKRRGQLSVNARFNNKVAVLSGDFLLATSLVQVSLTKNNDIISLVARLGQDLSDGELLQLLSVSTENVSEEMYFDVIKKKTAVLFVACCEAAALSVGAAADDVQNARLFGEYLGLSFQIKDDIFDYYKDSNVGKPTGNDLKEGKITLPLLYALSKNKNQYYADLAKKAKLLEATDKDIEELITFAHTEGGITYAENRMYAFRDEALKLLNKYDNPSVCNALKAFIDYVVDRKI